MTGRERDIRWTHHVVAVSVHPFDPRYALERAADLCDATIDEVRAVLREHGSITFGRADNRLLALDPCRRPQCGDTAGDREDGYCSLDCAISDRAPAVVQAAGAARWALGAHLRPASRPEPLGDPNAPRRRHA